MIETGLQGKVALITGANNPLGIGAATARTLSREGVKVFLTYFRLRPEQWGFPGRMEFQRLFALIRMMKSWPR